MSADIEERADQGFSVVEIIVAMFLMAVLAIAVLPLVIGATQASTVNRSLVAAEAFAQAQLAPIRVDYPDSPDAPTSCAALRAGHQATGTADPADTGLRADVTVASCPAASEDYPASVQVTVTVYRDGEADAPLVTLPTRVAVAQP